MRLGHAGRTGALIVMPIVVVTAMVTGCGGSSTATTEHRPTATGTLAPPTGSATSGGSTDRPTPTASRAAGQLPRGGRELFPRYRLVGYSGGAGSAAFGRLGTGSLTARGKEVVQHARSLAGDRQPMPVFELIAVVAHDKPGRHGQYNSRVDDAVITRYLAAARRQQALLLLNIQPGRQDFLPLVKGLRRWLDQPDVGLALDPEWAVGRGQVPGSVYGRTTGQELDAVAAYLDDVVRAGDLPQKAMVFHQVAAKVVADQQAVRARPGVVVIKSVDGIGSPGAKTATWRVLVEGLPAAIHPGFKLFFDEDTRHGPLMTPAQVLALRPAPEYVLYE